MAIYRIKQFYWSITAKIGAEDEKYIKAHLNEQEIALFNRLQIYEKKHSIKVASDIERLYEGEDNNKKMLIKAALIHDIGKIEKKLNLVDKSILVVMNKVTHGNMKKYMNLKKIDVYYNHADIGYNMLKKFGYDERLLYLIKNHHNDNIIGDKELDMLKKCDNMN